MVADFNWIGANKSKQTVSAQSFFENPSGHGRLRRKTWMSGPKGGLSVPLEMGRDFLTPGHPGVRVWNVRRKFGPKSLCL